MQLLLDDETAPYLLRLSLEVIDWAEKDDIPAYMNYLHKSFELAARQNYKTAMQRIADALADVLTKTTLGTNRDKARMQDYQAAVQENPVKAIAFRRGYSTISIATIPMSLPKLITSTSMQPPHIPTFWSAITADPVATAAHWKI